jgi:hypothetical protein
MNREIRLSSRLLSSPAGVRVRVSIINKNERVEKYVMISSVHRVTYICY